MRTLILILSVALCGCATPGFSSEGEGPGKSAESHGHSHSDLRPFEADRDATADVDAALAAARESGKLALIVMGGNWCHDSRGFAAALEHEDTAALIAENFETVWVDVGYKDENQHIPKRFGLDGTPGTPTVVIARGDGTVLNLEDAPTWRNAASRSQDDIHDYFEGFAAMR